MNLPPKPSQGVCIYQWPVYRGPVLGFWKADCNGQRGQEIVLNVQLRIWNCSPCNDVGTSQYVALGCNRQYIIPSEGEKGVGMHVWLCQVKQEEKSNSLHESGTDKSPLRLGRAWRKFRNLNLYMLNLAVLKIRRGQLHLSIPTNSTRAVEDTQCPIYSAPKWHRLRWNLV